MPGRIKIEVTPELIRKATKRDSRHCMIAEAIKADHPHFQRILVDLATIRWSNPNTGKRYVCITPTKAAEQLVRFDQGEIIEPFSFNVDIIQTTEMVRNKETPAEAKASGRNQPRRVIPSNKKELTTRDNGAKPHIKGGEPIPPGHLRGTSTPATENAVNKTRVGRAFRQYGRRMLAP